MLPILSRIPPGVTPKTLKDLPPITDPLIVGKGPSLVFHKSWAGTCLSCNDATRVVRRGIHLQYDVTLSNPELDYLYDLPPGVVAVVRRNIVGRFPPDRAYTFEWSDLGLKRGLSTALYGIVLAGVLWPGRITVCGLDYFTDGIVDYHPESANPRNLDSMQRMRLQQQVPLYAQIPPETLSRTFNHDGRRLADILKQKLYRST